MCPGQDSNPEHLALISNALQFELSGGTSANTIFTQINYLFMTSGLLFKIAL